MESDDGAKLFIDDDKSSDLFSRLEEELEHQSLVCCAIRARQNEDEMTECGLIRGNVYAVTGVRRVSVSEPGIAGIVSRITGREKLNLVRLKSNASDQQVTGEHSEQRLYGVTNLTMLLTRSPEWRGVSHKERQKLGLISQHESEFWVAWDDFLFQFTDLSITHLINTSVLTFSKTWHESSCSSEWSKPGLAGGCFNHSQTFLNNPQFRFDINHHEADIIIQLSQVTDKNPTVLNMDKVKLVIGFHILKVESNREYRLHSLMQNSEDFSSDYIRYHTRTLLGFS